MTSAVTYVVIARVPPDGVGKFLDYEARVLPLIAEHGGRLERRLRTTDGSVEVHVVSFPSADHFEAYKSDARRLEHAHLLSESGAVTEVLQVHES